MWITSMSPWCVQSLLCHPAPSPPPPHPFPTRSFFFLFFFSNHTYFKGSALSCHRAADLRMVWGKLGSRGEHLRWNPVNRSSLFSSHCWDGEKELQINIDCGKVIFVCPGDSVCICVRVCVCECARVCVCKDTCTYVKVFLCMIENCTCRVSQWLESG